MLPPREGLFNAYPVEIGIDETGPHKLATCLIRFRLYEEFQASGEWADCAGENWEIVGYFYLEKKDGTLNTVAIDALKAALGWDGRDPFWLQETDLSQHAVQVKLGFEEYGGKTRLRVQYLNPFGSSGVGGVSKADDATRRTIGNRLGSKLRALSGPAPVAARPAKPAKPARPAEQPTAKRPPERAQAAPTARAPVAAPTPEAGPSAPQPGPAGPRTPEPQPAAAEASHDPAGSTPAEAWAAFCRGCTGPQWDQATLEREWFRILAELFPGKQPDELSPTEWAVMREEGPTRIVPF